MDVQEIARVFCVELLGDSQRVAVATEKAIAFARKHLVDKITGFNEDIEEVIVELMSVAYWEGVKNSTVPQEHREVEFCNVCGFFEEVDIEEWDGICHEHTTCVKNHHWCVDCEVRDPDSPYPYNYGDNAERARDLHKQCDANHTPIK